MNQIQGKVASVLTDRQLVINRGKIDGVEIGMKFAIMANRDSEVLDPDSGRSIGSVEVVKTIVKIVEVEEEMAIGKTFRTLKEDGGFFSMNAEMSRAFTPSSTKVETLDQSGRFSEREIDPAKSYVKIGDIALQVVTAEPLSTNVDVLAGVNTGTRRVSLTARQITAMARTVERVQEEQRQRGYRHEPSEVVTVEVSVDKSGQPNLTLKKKKSDIGFRDAKKTKN